MTSQKYSANKQNAMFDFKRALKNLIPPAIVSLLIGAYYFILMPIDTFSAYINDADTAAKNLERIRQNVAVALTGGDYYSIFFSRSVESITIGGMAVIIGVLFALFSFAFLMNKKSVNVYLSIGLDRKTLFRNRVLSSILLMAATAFLPILVDVIMNIHYIGHASYVLGLGGALFLEFFTYMLAGFSLMAIAMMLCNTVIESLFFGAGVLWFPTLVVYSLSSFSVVFLRGFSRMLDTGLVHGRSMLNYTTIVNPLLFGKAAGNYAVTTNVFSYVCRGIPTAAENSGDFNPLFNRIGYEQMPFAYIVPILVWLVFSAGFIVLAQQILLRRKAENAGIHGRQVFVNHFFCAELALLVSATSVIVGDQYQSRVSGRSIYHALVLLIAILIFAVSFFIFISISMRKIKHGKKELVTVLSSVGILCVTTLILVTGGFGYTTRVPDLDTVKYAMISSNEINSTGGEDSGYYNVNDPSGNIFVDKYNEYLGMFDGKKDLEKFVQVHKSLTKKPSTDIERNVTVKYVMKDNSVLERTYDMVDDNTLLNVLSLTDTDSYKNELSFLLSPERKDEKTSHFYEISLLSDGLGEMYPSGEDAQTIKTVLYKGTAHLINSDGALSEEIRNTDELKAAILKDLLATNYKDRYTSNEKPIGAVLFYHPENTSGYEDEFYDYTDDAYEEIIDPETGEISKQSIENTGGTAVRYYIYPSMKNTVNYLKSTGEYALIKEDNAVEEYEVKTVMVMKMSDLVKAMKYGFYESSSRLFYTSFLLSAESYDYNYKEAFEKGKLIKEADQIKTLADASRISGFAFDDDYIVLFCGKGYRYTRIIKAAEMPDFAK